MHICIMCCEFIFYYHKSVSIMLANLIMSFGAMREAFNKKLYKMSNKYHVIITNNIFV
jgi:hypothetical protein